MLLEKVQKTAWESQRKFFNKYHTDPDFPDDCEEEKFGGMFRFEKAMR